MASLPTSQHPLCETNPAVSSAASGLPELLTRAIAQLRALGTDYEGEQEKLRQLRERLIRERFHLAVLGQFKRGKSTLLNALLGETLLPSSVVPLTAIPTWLFPGDTRYVRITHRNGTATKTFSCEQAEELAAVLARFVTEEGNPRNQRQVAQVEVYHPASILQQGIVLIDTPGIGSTLRHNTEATLNFLPQCDAALFLVSADPPLTEVEVEFLKEVRRTVAHLFFVLNKVDYLNDRERETALAFLKQVLKEQMGLDDPGPIFCISARQGLEARLTDDAALWEASGLAELEEQLLQFLVSDKQKVLQKAVAGKAVDSLAEVLMRVQLSIRSLRLPLADLSERQRRFEQTMTEVEQQRRAAQDMLNGDHKRLTQLLEEQAAQLRQKARQHFLQIVQEALACTEEEAAVEQVAQRALAAAIPEFFERESREMSQLFCERVQQTLVLHQQRADTLVETLRRTAAELFEISYRPLDSSGVTAFEQQPYWVTEHWQTRLSPFSPQVTDRLLPARVRQARRLARLQEQIDRLVMHNVENLRWATRQNLDQAIRVFSGRLDERLQETGFAAQRAIEVARRRREEQAETVHHEIVHLEAKAQALASIQADMENSYVLS